MKRKEEKKRGAVLVMFNLLRSDQAFALWVSTSTCARELRGVLSTVCSKNGDVINHAINGNE